MGETHARPMRRRKIARCSSRSLGRRITFGCITHRRQRSRHDRLSRFFKDLVIPLTANMAVSPFVGSAVGGVPEAIEIDTLTLHDLSDFESCPLKVAYRHRMSIRSRRYEVPFLQASGVIYEVLDRLGDMAAGPEPVAMIEGRIRRGLV